MSRGKSDTTVNVKKILNVHINNGRKLGPEMTGKVVSGAFLSLQRDNRHV